MKRDKNVNVSYKRVYVKKLSADKGWVRKIKDKFDEFESIKEGW